MRRYIFGSRHIAQSPAEEMTDALCILEKEHMQWSDISTQTDLHLQQRLTLLPAETRIFLAGLRDAADAMAKESHAHAMRELAHRSAINDREADAPRGPSAAIRVAAGFGIATLAATGLAKIGTTHPMPENVLPAPYWTMAKSNVRRDERVSAAAMIILPARPPMTLNRCPASRAQGHSRLAGSPCHQWPS